jgi:hypothetical protein
MRRLLAPALLCSLAAFAVACGADQNGSVPTRRALEKGLLGGARSSARLADTTSVSCVRPAARLQRWNCTLEGRRQLTVTVSIDRRGSWSTDSIKLPSGPVRTTADGALLGEFTPGMTLFGCCVPTPK